MLSALPSSAEPPPNCSALLGDRLVTVPTDPRLRRPDIVDDHIGQPSRPRQGQVHVYAVGHDTKGTHFGPPICRRLALGNTTIMKKTHSSQERTKR